MARSEKPRTRANTPTIQQAARTLRRAMTPAEQALWRALRGRQLNGLHFRRQQPAGRFVLDFHCAGARLCVEVDGGVHDDPDQQAHDAERTSLLNCRGIRVLRVTNRQVLEELARTLEIIAAACEPEEEEVEVRALSPPPPAPPPQAGEG